MNIEFWVMKMYGEDFMVRKV